ncbi:hypothetical protein QOZ80_2BG0192530 [Eleusine coracana subsp. coracana]|nr:hypothetical protein QOZ80_2BG0192530 [Eleusine coracana subsp. coracana]
MQLPKRVVLVSAAVAALGSTAVVLGFLSESAKSKAFVRYDGQRCVYRRTAAFGCGIAAAALALAGMAVVTAASGGFFGRRSYAAAPGRSSRSTLLIIAWVVVLVAAMLFGYGAWRNAGGTSGLTRSRAGWRFSRTYRYGCSVLRGGVFVTASVASAAAMACAVAAYVNLHTAQFAADPAGVAMRPPPQWSSQPYPTAPSQFAQPAGPGVAVGQPQWPQAPYPPGYPAVAYPAAAPHHHGYGDGYAGKQPAGTS